MIATLKLINIYFWKTIYGPILSFIFPILLLGILGNIMRIEYVYPGIISLNMLLLGVLALPLAIMELKGSLLFKYIGSSPVNPLKFSFVVIFYYIFISLITGLLTLLGTITIFYDKVFPTQQSSRFGILGWLFTFTGIASFVFGSFFHLLLVIVSGIAIATFAKTPQQALTFAIIIIFPSMFLSGMIITIDIIAKSETMQWISRVIPFRYSTGNLVVATTPPDQLGDIFRKLSISEKQLIFGLKKGVVTDKNSEEYGNIAIDLSKASQQFLDKIGKVKADTIYLRSVEDIHNFIIDYQIAVPAGDDNYLSVEKLFQTFFNPDLDGDFFLFRSILLNPDALNNSSNNIFNLIEAWSVRKILLPADIKSFVQSYLSNEGSSSGSNPTRFLIVASKISEGDFRFLDLFVKQSTKMYSIPEKSLNIFVPLLFPMVLGLYINKRFTWTSR